MSVWLQRHFGSGLRSRSLPWAPTLVGQDPNPPLPLSADGAALEARAIVTAELTAADHEPAVAFDAAADALQLTGGSFPANNSDYTIAIWVRRKAANQDPAFIVENDASGTTLALALQANVPGLLNGSGFVWNVTIGSALLADVWYFLAMRVSGTTGTITRGNETEPCTHASGTIVAQAAPFRMWYGGTTSSFFPTADLALLRQWNRVLSDAELEAERKSATPVTLERIAGDHRMRSAADRGADVYARQHLTSPGVGPWADTDGPTLGRDTLLASTLSITASVTADLTTSPASGLAAALTSTATISASLTTAIQMASAVAGSATVAAPLTTAIRLAAAVSSTATVSAALTTEIRLAAAPAGAATLSAALTTAIQLAAGLQGTAAVVAPLTTAIRLASGLTGTATTSADLTTGGGTMAAGLASTASVSASLTTAIQLQAAPSGTATVGAALTTAIRLASAISSTATVSAPLTTQIRLASSLSATATVGAALTTQVQFASDLVGTATATADLSTGILLEAALTGLATLEAEFSSLGPAPAGLWVYAGDVGTSVTAIGTGAEVVPIGTGGATVAAP